MSTQPSPSSRPSSPLRKKVVLVGDTACGKTSLLRSLCRQGFSPDYEPTTYDSQVVRFRTARCNDRRNDDDDASDEESPRPSLVEVTFCDTSGDDAYDRLRPLSYPDADLVLLCFAMTSPASMRSVSGRWAAEVRHHMPRVPVMLVGTKCDKLGAKESSSVEAEEEDFVTNVEGRLLSRMVGAEEFLECSSALGGRHNRGVSKIRRRMLQMLQESGATRRWKKWAKMAVMMA